MTDLIELFENSLHERLVQGGPFIQVLLGPRQVGKTTIIKKICASWKGPVIYVSADLPAPPKNEWIIEHWNRARIEHDKSENKNTLLVFDEIQKVERWSEVVKALYDQDRHSGLRLVILGSASLAIYSGITESLLGRYEVMRLPHWGYLECKNRFSWSFDTFLKFGGYPAPAVLINDAERWQTFLRDSIIEAIISRDILLLKDIAKPALFRQTFELAMRYPAALVSYDKFIGQLQDRGNATTVKSYLETLEQAFLVRILEKFTTRALSSKASSPKIIALCPALIHSFTNPATIDSDSDWYGQVFESVIGAHLSYFFKDNIFYWREKHYEVDFVIKNDNKIYALEIKSGRKKKSSGLNKFRDYFSELASSVSALIIDRELGQELLLKNAKSAILEFLDRLEQV